jgi:glycosyltransferase involved in cell wall biosynthesis
VFEALAMGRPVIVVSNLALSQVLSYLPLSLESPVMDAEGLADRIIALNDSELDLLAELGRELRPRVEQGHRADHWGDSMLGLMRSRTQARGRGLRAGDGR